MTGERCCGSTPIGSSLAGSTTVREPSCHQAAILDDHLVGMDCDI
jgi:hypothetical protein